MPSRTQITLDAELDRKAKMRAHELGISFAEYVRRVIARDLSNDTPSQGVSALVGIGDSGGSEVATSKDDYLNEAFDH